MRRLAPERLSSRWSFSKQQRRPQAALHSRPGPHPRRREHHSRRLFSFSPPQLSQSRRYTKLNPMSAFRLGIDYKPRGDQPAAIDALVRGLKDAEQHQVLLGVTGSGKTFTMAKVIEKIGYPALVLAHNKTLAAQLYQEFQSYFPSNAVEYFVSYYDYYQPEAYIPAGDVYIEKEATINDELDRLRLSATRSLFERRDCVIVASVSCIYGLGSPEAYYGMLLFLEKGQKIKRQDI